MTAAPAADQNATEHAAAAAPVYAGVDVSKAKLDLATDGRADAPVTTVDNTPAGHAAIVAALRATGRPVGRVVVEATGGLERPLVDALLGPFPPISAGARIASRLGPSDLLRFARFAVLPVRRMADEEFAGPGGGLLLGGNALHSDLGPESPISGFMGWLLCMLGQTVGFPAPVGGAGALTAALVRRLESRGGSVVCSNGLLHDDVLRALAPSAPAADG